MEQTNMAKNTATAIVPAADYAVMKHGVDALQEVIRANIGSGNLGPGDLERIKVPAGGGTTWTIPSLDGDIDTKEFDGVIVAWKTQRAYWKEKYSGGSVPPDCASDDGITGSGDPGGVCEQCPYSQFESATDEKGEKMPGQACKQIRLMAVVQKDDLVPVLLSAPPTSLANMRRYFLRLASRAKPFYAVVTRFTLVKAQSAGGITFSQIEANAIEQLDDEQQAKMEGFAKVIGDSLERRTGSDAADYDFPKQ